MSTNRLQKMGCTGRITALLAPVALLSACADASLSKPEIRLPGAFQTSATAANADLPTASLDRWWTLFGDPQLETLVEQALVAAPDARTAVARLEEALALRSERMRSLLPQGNLQGSATHQETNQSSSGSGGFAGFNTPGGLDTLSLQFAPSWEIDLFGRSRTARRIADADLATTRFNVEAARMSLAANVGRQLFQARALAIQLEDARESRRISAELTRVTGIRAERGLGTRADAARVRTDLESAEAEIVRLEAALRAATRTLLVLLGRGADPLESLPIEARTADPPVPPATTPADLLARRPDVREAEARLRAAAGTVNLDRLALFPTLTLRPSASLSRTSGAYEATTSVWSIGVDALVPVLDRPRLLAALRGERARGEQAVIAFERAVQTAYGEAENALSTLDADRARLTRLAAAEADARYAFDAAQRGFRAGLTDITPLLDAERSWRAARSTLSAARNQSLQDAVAAFQALGGGWSPLPLQTAAADPAR